MMARVKKTESEIEELLEALDISAVDPFQTVSSEQGAEDETEATASIEELIDFCGVVTRLPHALSKLSNIVALNDTTTRPLKEIVEKRSRALTELREKMSQIRDVLTTVSRNALPKGAVVACDTPFGDVEATVEDDCSYVLVREVVSESGPGSIWYQDSEKTRLVEKTL